MIDKVTTFFYWINVRTWCSFMMLIAVRLRLEGKDNMPRHGPLIFVSNHLNNADPLVLTVVSPRRLVWMTKREWFSTPVVGWLFHLFGLIPVRRFEADLQALRKAQQALERGSVLGMFPEGTRSKTAAMAEGEPGTALIALRTQAPILPVAIWGTEDVKLPRDFLRRTSVNVRMGQPFRLEKPARLNKQHVAEGTREIMNRIAELLPEKYRGVYSEPAARAVAGTE